MKNISAKNLRFSENTTIGAHVDQIWALRQLLSLIYVCLKFLARMLFSSNSPYLSRLNFGKLRKNEIAAISSKMTFFTFRKKRCARNWPYFNISKFQRNLFFKVDPPPYGLNGQHILCQGKIIAKRPAFCHRNRNKYKS